MDTVNVLRTAYMLLKYYIPGRESGPPRSMMSQLHRLSRERDSNALCTTVSSDEGDYSTYTQ